MEFISRGCKTLKNPVANRKLINDALTKSAIMELKDSSCFQVYRQSKRTIYTHRGAHEVLHKSQEFVSICYRVCTEWLAKCITK